MKKLFAAILLITLALTSLASCGEKIKNDVDVSVLATEVEKGISDKSNLSEADEDYMVYNMNTDFAKMGDYIVKTPESNKSLDEYGIFKAESSEQLEYIQKLVSDYLAYRLQVWDTRYHNEELPKLEGAKQKTVGMYVVYVILSESERNAAISNFEKALKG